MKYQWKKRQKGNAEKVAKYIESLGQNVTPEMLVKKAKAKRSIIHDYFEWNDTAAAKRYRIIQARDLLQSIEVVIEHDNKGPVKVRAFCNVVEDDKRVYTTVQRAKEDPELWNQVKEQALEEIKNWRRIYKHIKEFEVIFEAIEKITKAA